MEDNSNIYEDGSIDCCSSIGCDRSSVYSVDFCLKGEERQRDHMITRTYFCSRPTHLVGSLYESSEDSMVPIKAVVLKNDHSDSGLLNLISQIGNSIARNGGLNPGLSSRLDDYLNKK